MMQTSLGVSSKGTHFRYWIAALFGFGTLVNYFDRINLTVASTDIMHEFHMSPGAFGILASAFAWTYTMLQIPTGVLLDRIGVKWLNRICSALWVISTGLTAFISGLFPLFMLRLLLGVAEAPAFAAASKGTGYWFPLKERGIATVMFDVSSKLSNVIGTPFVALVVALWGWRAAFIVTALVSLIYCVWFWVLYRDPSEHHKLSKEEFEYIKAGDAQKEEKGSEKVRLIYLLKQRKIIGYALGAASFNYSFYLFLTWLPNYLETTMNLNILKSGIYTAIPWLFGALCNFVIGGLLVDHLIKKGLNPSKVRKWVMSLGLVAGLAVLGAKTTTNVSVAIVWLSIATAGISTTSAINWSIPSIIAPTGGVGTVGGIMNFVGNLSAIAAPMITGFIVEKTGNFSSAFELAGVILLVGIFAYTVIMGEISKIPDEESRERKL